MRDLIERLEVATADAQRIAALEAKLTVAREALGAIAEGDMPKTHPDGSKRWFNGGEGGWEWAREKAAAALKEIKI